MVGEQPLDASKCRANADLLTPASAAVTKQNASEANIYLARQQ